MKRFWTDAAAELTDQGYVILLDGKPMHLPGGTTLRVPHGTLARAIAEEWQTAGGSPGGEMSLADTPLTRLAGTMQERIAPDPWPTVDAIARYGEHDLLCYRAEAPPALVERQASLWQPWLDWAAITYDAPLRVTAGITPIKQHRSSVAALRAAVAQLDLPTLAALGIAVPAFGSLVLGLALAAGELDAATAHRLAAMDELFQAEFWGNDDEAVIRRANIAADIALAARFIELSHA